METIKAKDLNRRVESKYLGSKTEAVERLFKALCKLTPDVSVGELLEQEGIAPAEWRSLARDPATIRRFYEIATRDIVLAYMPTVMKGIAEKATKDPKWATLFLKMARIMPGDINIQADMVLNQIMATRQMQNIQINEGITNALPGIPDNPA